MRAGTYDTFPLLRRRYNSAEEIGSIINRSRVAVLSKLREGAFTQKEKELIAKNLIDRGIESDTKETIQKYFGG